MASEDFVRIQEVAKMGTNKKSEKNKNKYTANKKQFYQQENYHFNKNKKNPTDFIINTNFVWNLENKPTLALLILIHILGFVRESMASEIKGKKEPVTKTKHMTQPSNSNSHHVNRYLFLNNLNHLHLKSNNEKLPVSIELILDPHVEKLIKYQKYYNPTQENKEAYLKDIPNTALSLLEKNLTAGVENFKKSISTCLKVISHDFAAHAWSMLEQSQLKILLTFPQFFEIYWQNSDITHYHPADNTIYLSITSNPVPQEFLIPRIRMTLQVAFFHILENTHAQKHAQLMRILPETTNGFINLFKIYNEKYSAEKDNININDLPNHSQQQFKVGYITASRLKMKSPKFGYTHQASDTVDYAKLKVLIINHYKSIWYVVKTGRSLFEFLVKIGLLVRQGENDYVYLKNEKPLPAKYPLSSFQAKKYEIYGDHECYMSTGVKIHPQSMIEAFFKEIKGLIDHHFKNNAKPAEIQLLKQLEFLCYINAALPKEIKQLFFPEIIAFFNFDQHFGIFDMEVSADLDQIRHQM